IPARNFFKLLYIVIGGLYADAAFRTAKGNIHNGTFKAHQGCKRFHFIFVHKFAVTYSALGGQLVMAVLHTDSINDLYSVIGFYREIELVNAVANPDLLQQSFRKIGKLRSLVKICRYVSIKL